METIYKKHYNIRFMYNADCPSRMDRILNNVMGGGDFVASGQSGLAELGNAACPLAEIKEEISETPGALHLGAGEWHPYCTSLPLHAPCKHFWFKRRKHNEIEAEL